MRYLGIDYGHKKVGLATSDESGRFAFPFKVLKNTPKLIEEIKNICRTETIDLIVVGESASLNGQINPITAQIDIFKKNLAEAAGLPVKGEREFFTTWEAKRMIDEKQNDPLTDARAAALILKSFIDRQTYLGQK